MKNIFYRNLPKVIFSLLLTAIFINTSISQTRLVGATSYGGTQFGTIFSIEPGAASFLTQKNLDGVAGVNPPDRMVEASNGKLYGMTRMGGNYQFGVLFEYDYTTDTYTKKIDFDDVSNGYNPEGGLTKASNGKLYGVVSYGGPSSDGVLFEYDVTTGILTNKKNFSELGGQAAFPSGNLVQASNGKLYGYAFKSAADVGVIYEYDIATDTYTEKLNTPPVNFMVSGGMAEGPDGNLYGIVSQGGINNAGFIFRYDYTANTYTVLLDMSVANGSLPVGTMFLAANGKFYGTTYNGGANDAGVVFEYDYTTNIYTKKIDLSGTDGSLASGSLIEVNPGKLYGYTTQGGATNDGVIFEYDYTTNTYTKKIDMVASNGSNPQGSLALAGNGKLYGNTPLGGLVGGVIFEYDQIPNTYTKKKDFGTSINGNGPLGSLVSAGDGKLYGITAQGGVNGEGVIYEFDCTTNNYVKKIDLVQANGYVPNGSLMKANNGKMYGMTQFGGINNKGVIFEYDYITNTYTKKIDLTDADGSIPACTLLQAANGKLYGITQQGGFDSKGVIFEYDYITNAYTKKIDFNNTTGNPVGLSLVEAGNGKLYGSTRIDNNNGSIFEYDYITNTYTKKIDLTVATGLLLRDPMMLAANGKLYGAASIGGANGKGAIFEYDYTTNGYTKKIDLSDAIGSSPAGSMLQSSVNGKLYGMVSQGGANSLGGIYEYDYTTNTYTLINSFDYLSGYAPLNAGFIEVDFTIVPLSLLDFKATRAGNTALLTWETSQEINSSYIDIERSPDGGRFNFLNRMNAAGNSATLKNYSFTDTKVLPGKNYYRLKLVSTDGRVQYSDIRMVEFDPGESVVIYPNPLQSQVNMIFDKSWINKAVKLSLYNGSGQQVWQKEIAHANQIENFPLNKIANGFYILKLEQQKKAAIYKKVQVLN